MLVLKMAQVYKYKSIDDSTPVNIDPKITVLVGKNESGKTAFLEALTKAHPLGSEKFNPVYDYPKREYTKYRPSHDAKTYAKAVELTYEVSDDLVESFNNDVFSGNDVLPKGFTFVRTTNYGNHNTLSIVLDQTRILEVLRKSLEGLEHVEQVFEGASDLDMVIKRIDALELSEDSKLATFAKIWHERAEKKTANWGFVDWHLWSKYLSPNIPKFFYFDDYRLLPGKINLPQLGQRSSSGDLNETDETVMGLLDLAGISLAELMSEEGYENSKAKLEAIGLTITDEIFNYWKQNQDLAVEFDVRDDSKDIAPFNNGKNLYIRIKNNRHGVTVPFDQRSKGFIWFFSFLTWFSAVQARLDTEKDLVLLLDEPGLNLHALAQADFLKYIDTLAESHQIIYSTHSPFMIKGGHLSNLRVVEDKLKEGTKVTEQLEGSGEESLFPLQAALGYSIAQNLFISEHNILVEGPADLILLQHMNGLLEASGRPGLTTGTFIPVGGLDKLATFIALLGANRLQLVVIHDRAGTPPQKLEDLIRNRIIEKKRVLDYSMYRTPDNLDTDIEDLFPASIYLQAFNVAYKNELGTKKVKEAELGPHPRIIERINRWLKDNGVVLLKAGGFNHYRVAQQLLPLLNADTVPKETTELFEKMMGDFNDRLVETRS